MIFGGVTRSFEIGLCSEESLRCTAAHCRGDLKRWGVADIISEATGSTIVAAVSAGSGKVGDAKRSNFRT
jgi:hypothetical protein